MSMTRRGFIKLLSLFPAITVFPAIAKTTNEPVSALDNVNVKRLVDQIKSDLQPVLEQSLFEPNDRITRDQLRNNISEYLESVKQRKGINDYCVVCDETNNTPKRIDNNELYIDLAIKPSTPIEFIYVPIKVISSSVSLV